MQQIGIDGDAAVIIHVSLRDRRVMNFGLQELDEHRTNDCREIADQKVASPLAFERSICLQHQPLVMQ